MRPSMRSFMSRRLGRVVDGRYLSAHANSSLLPICIDRVEGASGGMEVERRGGGWDMRWLYVNLLSERMLKEEGEKGHTVDISKVDKHFKINLKTKLNY